MKKHAIIPIFIPHEGCQNDCVFCNQKKITSKTESMTPDDARETIETWLKTLEGRIPNIEVAFYGGSFTGLPIEIQNSYLDLAKKYKYEGRISKIHLSTRPDYISEEILDNLKAYSVDIIELGVQSFSDKVLIASKRGHKKEDVYKAVKLIKEYGFTFGIQLMAGLPEDTLEISKMSAIETVKLKPHIARIYPCITIKDTELYDMYKRGEYTPLSLEEAIKRSKAIYHILDSKGINIIRVGLKASEIINDSENSSAVGNTFHPAFRQLLESDIAKDHIVDQLEDLEKKLSNIKVNKKIENLKKSAKKKIKVNILSNSNSISNAIGNRKSNKIYFKKHYPNFNIKFKIDNTLKNNEYNVEISL